MDSDGNAKDKIIKTIKTGTKKFLELLDELKEHFEEEKTTESFTRAVAYITNNWAAARNRMLKKGRVIGSSTEGHVYHVLLSRISTQAMGWSLTVGGQDGKVTCLLPKWRKYAGACTIPEIRPACSCGSRRS